MLAEIAPDIQVVAIFQSFRETHEFINIHKNIDLLFLDIHVADGNSFELFDLSEIRSKVIFTTAFDKYAIEAFRKNAVDYLLKPLKKDHLIEALEKVTKSSSKGLNFEQDSYKARIVINFMSKIHSIKVEDIAYIYSKNKISYFYLRNGDKLASDFKLQELEEELNPTLFFRANRQFIIHIDAIEKIIKHQASRVKVTLKPEITTDLVISTEKTPLFKKWLDR